MMKFGAPEDRPYHRRCLAPTMEPRVHHRVWETAAPAPVWKPVATYGLLAAFLAVFVAQLATMGRGGVELHNAVWTISADWIQRPWSPLTSTFAHGGPGHLLVNGLMMFFFGPLVERTLGRRNFILLFVLAGIASGIAQAELSAAFGTGRPALGASGGLMAIFGTMAVLFPNRQILIYGIIPLKFWIAALLYAAYDITGAFDPNDGIGNFAHLAGMAIGALVGLGIRRKQAGTNINAGWR